MVCPEWDIEMKSCIFPVAWGVTQALWVGA